MGDCVGRLEEADSNVCLCLCDLCLGSCELQLRGDVGDTKVCVASNQRCL